MSAEAKEEETPAQVTRDRARRKAFWKRKKVLQETKSVASPQVSVVIHPVNSGACLEPTHFVSETKTIASPQVSVVSHPVNSGACLEPTFFDSEPNIHLTLEKETVHTAKFQSDLNKLCAEETESEQSDSEIDSPSASGNCLKEGEQSLRCTGCTRFIQKVSGLLPLIKCLVSNTAQDAGFQPTQEMLEQENDRQESMLTGKVKALKSLTIDIGNEVRDQNKMLAGMDDDFDSSGNLLQSTMGRLKQITRAGGWKQMCYLLLFCLFVFFICWVIIRSR